MQDSEMILDISETRTDTHVRWWVYFRGFTAADVTVPRPDADQEIDTSAVTQAIADRFGVDVSAVTYRNRMQRPPVRFLPQQAVVTLASVTPERTSA